MKNRLITFWKNYKFRFVPWVAFNLKQTAHSQKHEKSHSTSKITPEKDNIKIRSQNQSLHNTESVLIYDKNITKNSSSDSVPDNPIIVHHVQKGHDKVLSDHEVLSILTKLFSNYLQSDSNRASPNANAEDTYLKNLEIMFKTLGYIIERRKSQVSDDAGTGVFLTSGKARAGSLIGLYPGAIYMPSEPLFFPSVGNPFIFRCSDGVHIDGNDKWISKSIFKSCAARDKFRIDLPCCDESWLTSKPLNSLNIGQYVNNRSKQSENNVIYQESSIKIGLDPEPNTLPVHLCKYLPNVWANPDNTNFPVRMVPLVAVKEINEGDEILSSYFTVVH